MAMSVDHESSALYCMISSDACTWKLILRCCGCKLKLLLFSSNVSSSGEKTYVGVLSAIKMRTGE